MKLVYKISKLLMALLLFSINANPIFSQTFELNRLTTKVTPQNIILKAIDDEINLHILVTNTSSVEHTNVSFNYIFKDSEIELVSGCTEEVLGDLNPGESLESDCVIKVKPDLPEYIGETIFNVGTFSTVGSSSLASSNIIKIALPRTDANAISKNILGCFDKDSYVKYTKTYQNVGDVNPTETRSVSTRYLLNRYSIAVAGLILGIYLLPKKNKKKFKRLGLILPTLIILSSLGLLAYRLNVDKCYLFPHLEYCESKNDQVESEASDFTELLRGEGGIQVDHEILESGNILLKDGYGRWQIEYPPYFNNQFFPETKSVVIAGPSANANPDSGLLTVETRINVFEKEEFSGYDNFKTYVRRTIVKQGVKLLSENSTKFNIYDAEVLELRDSTFNNSEITADGKIYIFETPRSFVIFSLYTNNNCSEVFSEDIQLLMNSFLLTDEGANSEI